MAAVGAAIGAGVGGAFDLAGGMLANSANQDAAKVARKFTLMMSNTAVQRRMADLRAAGVNPLLAISHESASSGAAPMAHMGSPTGDAGSKMAMAATNAAQIALANSQARANNARAQLDEDAHSAGSAQAETDLKRSQEALNNVQSQVQSEEIKRIAATTALTGEQAQLTVQERERVIVATDKLWREMELIGAQVGNVNQDTIRKRAETDATAQRALGEHLDNVQKSAVLELAIEAATSRLKSDVASGKLTESQADQKLSYWKTYLGDLAAKWSVIASPISSAINLAK